MPTPTISSLSPPMIIASAFAVERPKPVVTLDDLNVWVLDRLLVLPERLALLEGLRLLWLVLLVNIYIIFNSSTSTNYF